MLIALSSSHPAHHLIMHARSPKPQIGQEMTRKYHPSTIGVLRERIWWFVTTIQSEALNKETTNSVSMRALLKELRADKRK